MPRCLSTKAIRSSGTPWRSISVAAVCLWRDNQGEKRATIRMGTCRRGAVMIVAPRHECKDFCLSRLLG
jgi:hypothetical protein